MSEKRFVQCEIEYGFANTTNIKKIDGIYDVQEEKTYRIEQIVDLLNEQQATINKQQDQISYWKHKVNSLLWILSQFDKEKVKELLKEVGE